MLIGKRAALTAGEIKQGTNLADCDCFDQARAQLDGGYDPMGQSLTGDPEMRVSRKRTDSGARGSRKTRWLAYLKDSLDEWAKHAHLCGRCRGVKRRGYCWLDMARSSNCLCSMNRPRPATSKRLISCRNCCRLMTGLCLLVSHDRDFSGPRCLCRHHARWKVTARRRCMRRLGSDYLGTKRQQETLTKKRCSKSKTIGQKAEAQGRSGNSGLSFYRKAPLTALPQR